MQELVRNLGNPSVVSYCTLIHAYANGAMIDRVVYWINHMKERNIKPNAQCYTAIIGAFGEQNRVMDAEDWMLRMEADWVERDGGDEDRRIRRITFRRLHSKFTN